MINLYQRNIEGTIIKQGKVQIKMNFYINTFIQIKMNYF